MVELMGTLPQICTCNDISDRSEQIFRKRGRLIKLIKVWNKQRAVEAIACQ